MTIWRSVPWTVVPVLAWLVATALAADDAATKTDLLMLQEASIATDGAGLLAFLRGQTPTEEEQLRLGQMVRQLGDVSYEVRERASHMLLAKGRAALPFLRPALVDSDLEIRRRAQRCIDAIESGPSLGRLQAVIRVLAERRPTDAAEVMLSYLPFADHDVLEDEILAALKSVGLRDGRPEPSLAAALHDRMALKRAAAALVIGQAPAEVDRARVKALLQDPAAEVRLRAAEGLLAARQKDAVPVFIALLSEAPVRLAYLAEEHLGRIAGEQSPQVALGSGDVAGRRKCRAAWQDWWQVHGASLDETRLSLEQRTLGLTLVVVYDGYANGQGRIWEFGSDRKERWSIEGDVQGPIDAQILSGNRLLVAEYNGQRVTERDLSGKVLWEYKIEGNPVACQRLPNGNTLIATLNAVMEILPNKTPKYIYPVQNHQVTYAHKLRNGQIYYVATNGVMTVLDSDELSKPVRTFKIGSGTEWFSFDLLAGGNLLVPQQSRSEVVEYRPDGTIVQSDRASTAYSAVRLPNGNILACSMNTSSLFEVNRAGTVVWKQNLKGRPFRVRRR